MGKGASFKRDLFFSTLSLGDLIQSLIFKFHSYHMMPKFYRQHKYPPYDYKSTLLKEQAPQTQCI